jgi:hypothetical protein
MYRAENPEMFEEVDSDCNIGTSREHMFGS